MLRYPRYCSDIPEKAMKLSVQSINYNVLTISTNWLVHYTFGYWGYMSCLRLLPNKPTLYVILVSIASVHSRAIIKLDVLPADYFWFFYQLIWKPKWIDSFSLSELHVEAMKHCKKKLENFDEAEIDWGVSFAYRHLCRNIVRSSINACQLANPWFK